MGCIWKVAEEDRHCEFCSFNGGCEARGTVMTLDEKAVMVLGVMNDIIGEDVRVRCAKSRLVWARNMVEYKLSSYGMSLNQIGMVVKRDHSTVFNGIRRFNDAMKYPSMYQDVMEIWNSFKERLNLENL